MRILIIGSTNMDNGEKVKPEFSQACKELGAALARERFEFVIGSSNVDTADRYVLEGAATAPGTHRVWIYRPDKGDTPELPTCDPAVAKFEVFYKRLRGPWAAGRLPQLQVADVVLLIGGGRGTAQVGYAAMALGKPTVSIGGFKGAAEELWPFLEPFYQRVGRLNDEIGNLREKWKPDYADLVVRVARELVRKGAFRQRNTRVAILALVLNVLLFVSWVWFFVSPPFIWQGAIFALLAISAFLGTSLRVALRDVADPTEQKSIEVVIAELSAGLVLAFALAMLYLAGSFTFTGKFQPFTDQSKIDDYQRVAVGLTLIGVAGGWLLEKVAERLSHALGDPLGETESETGA